MSCPSSVARTYCLVWFHLSFIFLSHFQLIFDRWDITNMFSLSASFYLIPLHLRLSLAAMTASCFLVSSFFHTFFRIRKTFFSFLSLARTSTLTPHLSNLSYLKSSSFHNLSALDYLSHRGTALNAQWWPTILVIFLLRSSFSRFLEGVKIFLFSF